MLVIYDDNGTIINENTEKAAIIGSLYSLEVEIPEDKMLFKIDTSISEHTPVFVDVPRSDLEKLRDTVASSLEVLFIKDMEHDTEISQLKLEINKINALLMKGSDTNE